jgi:hypothetical protein
MEPIVTLKNILPKVSGSAPIWVYWVSFAFVVPLVEREEVSRFTGQFSGHVNFLGGYGEVDDRTTLKLQERLNTVGNCILGKTILLVLFDGGPY